MYVCICHAITDRQIRQAVEAGCGSMRELRCQLQVCSDCGKCARAVKDLLTECSGPCGACGGSEPCLTQVAEELDEALDETVVDAEPEEPTAPAPGWAAANA